MEAERDNLKKDAAIYNYIQEKLQKSLPYKMVCHVLSLQPPPLLPDKEQIVTLEPFLSSQIMELSAMEMEAPEISFEELLAKEKEDTAFWQRDGKMRSISSTK